MASFRIEDGTKNVPTVIQQGTLVTVDGKTFHFSAVRVSSVAVESGVDRVQRYTLMLECFELEEKSGF